mmetsp:Transcript_5039/g.12037  ORF Transcript_5039/g.12037 Transcript_5039/m.12037 type:complete len:94 (-) Transcript_5039:822-1103(-)
MKVCAVLLLSVTGGLRKIDTKQQNFIPPSQQLYLPHVCLDHIFYCSKGSVVSQSQSTPQSNRCPSGKFSHSRNPVAFTTRRLSLVSRKRRRNQ